jgi:HEAT repeat protein
MHPRLAGYLALTVSLSLSLTLSCADDPSTPKYWAKRLAQSKARSDRARVLDALRRSKFNGPAMVPMLLERFNSDKSTELKSDIARMLGELKATDAVDALSSAITTTAVDSDARTLNKEIANALTEIKDPKAIPVLKQLLSTGDGYTTVAAIEGLAAFKAKEAFEPLNELASKDGIEPFITKKAVIALGELADERAIPILIKRMFTEKGGVFYAEASFSLYQIGQASVPALLGALNESDKSLTAWAKENKLNPVALPLKSAQVLGDLHEPKAIKTLEQMVASKSELDDVRSLMKIRGADALGRLRSKDSVKVIAKQLSEEIPQVRTELVWGLIRIGGREALPQLLESATDGVYDARIASLGGVALLGDERELPGFEKATGSEAKFLDNECAEVDNQAPECKDKAATLKKRMAAFAALKPVLLAAKDCKSDATLWAKQLDAKAPEIRERAAYEMGRSNMPAMVQPLMQNLTETNLDARLAIIQAVDWLIHDNPESLKIAKTREAAVAEQLAKEKGQTEYVKTNEDLRRLLVKIRR